ncbi:MAG: TRAP transporter substrate-binding protein [Candidatus Accumulibacter sp.]|nr:TRAP transporter substrate-binding protein [Accumulibacter sp.]
MKKMGAFSVIFSGFLLAFGSAVQARDFRAADNQPADYPTGLAMQYMGEQISKATNGKYNIKVFSNSVLGSGKDTTEQVKIGALEMTRVSTSEFHGTIPETVIPSFPFLFRDGEHFHKAMYGAAGQQMLESFEKHGYIGLCIYEGGTRSIYGQKPFRSVADTKGMKIRVQPSDLWVAVIGAMGATATPIPFAEVYTALKTGLVDAAENNYASYESMKHFEAAPYYSETEHVMAPDVVVFSKKIWETLSKEEQDIIRQAAKDSVPYFNKLWDQYVSKAKEAVAKAGSKIVPAKDIDKQSFVDAVRPVWDKFATTPEQKTLLQKIVDAK